MTELNLLDALVARFQEVFKNYELTTKSGLLQTVRVFAQYLPQPSAITVNANSEGKSIVPQGYTADDYESNFPCVIVKLDEATDNEEGTLTQTRVNVRFLIGTYDESPDCQGYRDVLNIIEVIRQDLLTLQARVLNNRYRLEMPLKNYLFEDQAFKAWWGSWKLTDIFPDSFSLPSWDSVLSGWENAKSAITSGWSEVSKIFTDENLSIAWDVFTAGFRTSKDLIISGWENLKGVFSNIDFGGIWDSLASGFATICDSIKGAWNSVTGFIRDTWDTVSDYVSGAWKWTKGLFGYDTDAEDLEKQVQDITALNKMSETFAQRVAEMTAAWQPFKASLGEGFTQIYAVMQGVSDRIRGIVIPAVNELVSALSRVVAEVIAIVQAGNIEVDVRTPNQGVGGNVPQQYQRLITGRKRAEGGFITQPEIALIGEAGREIVIPLEKQARGTQLWIEAGRELGLITSTNNSLINTNITNNAEAYNALPQIVNTLKLQPEANSTAISYSELNKTQNTAQSYKMMPEIMNAMNIQPHATGGIFSQPHIGLVAEAGREAIIPLEDKSRGLPLWMAAGEEFGFSFGGSSATSNNISPVFAPNVNITVNGGEPDSEAKFRGLLQEVFEDLFNEFQERMQRVSFA